MLAALQGKVQQISGLEHRLDEINEIPKNGRRLKSVEEHLKLLEQEEQKYQTLRRQLYEDMSSGIVSQEEYKEFSRSFNENVETIRKAKTEMNRQRDCLNNLDVEHSEDYQLIREDYSRQYDGLRAALQEAENKKVEVERQIEEYLDMTAHLEEHLDSFGFDIQLIKSLVQRIEVGADKRIRIIFGFRDVFAELGKESAEK